MLSAQPRSLSIRDARPPTFGASTSVRQVVELGAPRRSLGLPDEIHEQHWAVRTDATIRCVACPTCGGIDREPIASGYWRCVSPVPRQTATGLHPSGQLGPAFITETFPCGTEYQEGSGGATPLCEHSTFSIGLCARCKRPVCGDRQCSRMFAGKRHCVRCIRDLDAEAKAAEARMRAEFEAGRAQERRQRRDRLDRLPSPSNPLEAATILFVETEVGPRRADEAVEMLKRLSADELGAAILATLRETSRRPQHKRLTKRSLFGAKGADVYHLGPRDVSGRDVTGDWYVSTNGRFVAVARHHNMGSNSLSSDYTHYATMTEDDVEKLLFGRKRQVTSWFALRDT